MHNQGCDKIGIFNFPYFPPTKIAAFPDVLQSLSNHKGGGASGWCFLKRYHSKKYIFWRLLVSDMYF